MTFLENAWYHGQCPSILRVKHVCQNQAWLTTIWINVITGTIWFEHSIIFNTSNHQEVVNSKQFLHWRALVKVKMECNFDYWCPYTRQCIMKWCLTSYVPSISSHFWWPFNHLHLRITDRVSILCHLIRCNSVHHTAACQCRDCFPTLSIYILIHYNCHHPEGLQKDLCISELQLTHRLGPGKKNM